MKRIKAGWQLTKKSWRVLSDSPGLVRFPLFGGLIALLITIVLIGPGLYLIEDDSTAIGAILVAVGLAHNADRQMHGENPTFADGMALASSRMGAVAGWAFVATIVMTIIRAIQERFGIAGAIIGGLAGAAWGILTFLAVPVIALEGTGPIQTIKRCAHLVKSRWGEQIAGTIAIGGIVFLVGFLPAILFIVAGVALWASSGIGGAILIAVGILILAVAALIQQSLATIFGVALYRYVAGQEAVGGFTEEELQSAVRLKRGATPAAGTI
jgi:hypothetical protein